MNNESGRFADRLKSAEQSSWKNQIFLDQSRLSKVLQSFADPNTKVDDTALSTEVSGIIEGLRFLETLSNEQSDQKFGQRVGAITDPLKSVQEIKTVIPGLIAALSVANELNVAKPSQWGDANWESRILADLDTAVTQYGRAWSKNEDVAIPIPKPRTILKEQIPEEEVVETAFSKLKKSVYSPTGYWIVRDLLDRWVTQKRLPKSAPSDVKTACTPLLGAEAAGCGGALLWLTVELTPYQNGVFCPDPVYHGLMSITHSDSNEDLRDAMDHVWKTSRLSRWFRGRWSFTTRKPGGDWQAPPLDEEIRQFHGRSIQAAALCALLSASGDSYGTVIGKIGTVNETMPNEPSDPLSDTVVISAQLGIDDPNQPLSEIPLLPVGGVSSKLAAARAAYQIDTVLLVKEEKDTAGVVKKLKERAKEFEKAQKNTATSRINESAIKHFDGVYIENVETVGQALDAMLVRNRYLKAYQAAVRDEWLKGWQQGTARFPGTAGFPGDDGPGPDDDNPPDKS